MCASSTYMAKTGSTFCCGTLARVRVRVRVRVGGRAYPYP